jgi:hypothetical protein
MIKYYLVEINLHHKKETTLGTNKRIFSFIFYNLFTYYNQFHHKEALDHCHSQ